jgi:hypothetical protein
MSVLKYKNDQGQWVGVPSLKGEQGVSVSDVEVTSTGHLKTTMSDGSTIDAGAIPSIITSVNGKTGAVELTASDVGAPTEDEIATMSNAIGIGESIVKTMPMFGTAGADVELGITTAQKCYIYIACTSSLADGQTITATPYWNGTLSSAYATSEMVFNKWYAINHPMVSVSLPLPKIQLKTNVDGIMASGVIYVRYAPYQSGGSNDIDTLANVFACDSVATDSFTSLSSSATSFTFNNAVKSKYEAYACITTSANIKVTITPMYSAVVYSAGVITNAVPGVWYKLAWPTGMSGTEFTLGLQLVLTYGASTSGIVTLRYMSTPTTS